MLKKLTLLVAALLTLATLTAACGGGGDSGGRLETVRDRDKLICGTRDDLTGLAVINSDREYEGFDVEFCKVIAAGILGDASKVEFKPLSGADRFPALRSGTVDLLIRNTTFTATRDGQEGANFLLTTLYDGQGFLVKESSNITTLEQLNNATICVTQGTTTEQNLTTVFASRGIEFTPLTFGGTAALQPAYESGACQAYTSDSSALAAYKFSVEQAGGEKHRLLPDIISKEPLGIVVADGDTEWAQAVNWAAMATIQAWEFGLDSTNIVNYSTDDGNIKNFLGRDGFDPGLGLAGDFAVNVVSQVGNYEEIYNRTLAPLGMPLDTALGGYNRLWTDGGLHYVPPYR